MELQMENLQMMQDSTEFVTLSENRQVTIRVPGYGHAPEQFTFDVSQPPDVHMTVSAHQGQAGSAFTEAPIQRIQSRTRPKHPTATTGVSRVVLIMGGCVLLLISANLVHMLLWAGSK